jgi:hypothetical protein
VTDSLLHSVLYGFAVYNLLVLLCKLLPAGKINTSIEKFDQSVCTFIPVVGLILFVINIVYLYSEINFSTDPYEGDFLQRMTGPYWFAYWFQYLLFLSPILLWFKKQRGYSSIRVILSIVLLFPLERVVIYITSFHRDYQPGNWTMLHAEQAVDWILHSGIFCAVAVVFHLIGIRFGKRLNKFL